VKEKALERRSIEVDGGRLIELLETGPADGPVVLFQHGTPGSVLQEGLLSRSVHARGWRLVTFSRAGYGGSSRAPGRSVADVVVDCRAVLDAVGAKTAMVAGTSGGGPHVLACAALLPERVSAALCIAGVAPYDAQGLDFLAGMGEENITEFGAALAGAEALRPYLETEADGLRTIEGAQIVDSMATLLPEADRACLTGEFADEAAASFRYGLARSVDGWLDDDLAFCRPWGFDLSTITVPVSLWQGDVDLMVPFSHGQWLSEHIPGVHAHLEPGEGHLSIAVGAIDRMLDELGELAGH
jgi:pimeloyl-ACP methyl ester carboxylesterase